MPRQKTALNKAAEGFGCPTCKVSKNDPCINIETGAVTPTHRTRQNLVCRETFLMLPSLMISNGEQFPMFCARRTGHRSQHMTPDKRLAWSRDFGVAEGRALYDELMSETG